MIQQTEAFDYALLRVVPRIDRGETLNAGVMLYCRARRYLGARVHLDADRLRMLDPTADITAIEDALQTVAAICVGDATAGPAITLDLGQRFRWLAAPRSTVIQASPTHTGLTTDPEAEVGRLLRLLVLPPTIPVTTPRPPLLARCRPT
ncbi:DUF3037 domain-containing protein [Nonomuraea helvata]|uniref:DUF3037 domain-containing protein n=1 Tax=Nonomuraea helvata TaxID=37484 RepID=A0ABV5SBZ4_9ACTN